MAQPKIISPAVIPQEVQFDIIALALLTSDLHRTLTAIENRQNSIIEKLTGAKMGDSLIADLFSEHNRRVAKSPRRRAA
jgi:hypothetical protein